MKLKVTGISFRTIKLELPQGTELQMVPDPKGLATGQEHDDENAISLWYFIDDIEIFLGYIPAAKTGEKFKKVTVASVGYKEFADRRIQPISWNKYIKGSHIASIEINCEIEEPESTGLLESDNKKSFNEDVVINFNEQDHKYTYGGRTLIGGTTYIAKFVVPFDRDTIIDRCVGAWGVDAKEIGSAWSLSGDVASTFGTAIHKAIEYEQLYSGHTKKNGDRCFSIKHPLINSIIKDFFKMYDKLEYKGESVPEALVSDVKNDRCGLVDNLLVTSWEKKTCRIQDYKVNHSVEKKGTTQFRDLPEGMVLPTNKLSKYSLQLKSYAEMLEDSGWTVEGFDVFVLDDKWRNYQIDMLDGFRLNE